MEADYAYLFPACPYGHRGRAITVKRPEDTQYLPAISVSDFRVSCCLTVTPLQNGKHKFVEWLSDVTAVCWEENETKVVRCCRHLEGVVRVSRETITYQDNW